MILIINVSFKYEKMKQSSEVKYLKMQGRKLVIREVYPTIAISNEFYDVREKKSVII